MKWLSRLLDRIRPEPPSIGPGEEVVLVDVRTGLEYRSGHARGAVHIPFHQMKDRWRELEQHRDRRVILYCLSGTRAAAATRVLRRHGFERAENGGSLSALRRAGVDTDRG